MSEGSSNRIIDLINFFAAHPTESFSLSEVLDHLPISTGSTHRALKSLTEAGYLSRHAKHKTYSLGLTLVAVGQAALERHPAVQLARGEMARLTAELGLQCVATVVFDEELISVAKTGSTPADQGIRHVGERRPFIPPLGLGHVAWAEPASIEAYLARGTGTGARGEEMRVYLRSALETIRLRGFAVAADGPAVKSVWQMIWDHAAKFHDAHYWAQMRRLLGDLSKDEFQLLTLDRDASLRLAYISAPVFSAGGEVVLSMSMSGFAGNFDGGEALQLAERLCTAAAHVTGETHGRRPRVGAWS
ncbi:MAG: transcriptional regulator, IclR family [Hydrocarboniphaga sp.]|uniref:helix-turn-helix domain-containing protein n=1 Tax=Hydrocarboniphaga sp. TaxID=2033016 RepID=UPI002604DFCD|nr:helix-turn-helix domain-containing protein [Hydrocarboniphaga sp.]MDB5970360.1 transcriptional regulator, IclR family [Hydrocarboniphaga sp.]